MYREPVLGASLAGSGHCFRESTHCMSTPLKGILVGLGARGHHWYDAVRSHPETEYVAYVEAADENRARAIERWELPPHRGFKFLAEGAEPVEADFTMPGTTPCARETEARGSCRAMPR